MNQKPPYELLAPVGNFPMLVAAVNAGANAVYFGIQGFNMRAGARNFELKDLPKIKEICKPKKIKMYLALNTIMYDEELMKVEKIIKTAKKYVDAVICWDLSVINLCKKHKVEFHISTQSSVANSEAAKVYKKLGAKRIVLARELNLKQVKEISNVIDVEAFCHGAMCVSVSGRCFMSQFLFNKSANRGQCLHPCRRSYVARDNQEGYELEVENDKIMSAKDLCTLPFIEKMKNSGIKSFKIEGRNRDPRYVDAVVRVYRKALDNKLSKKEILESMEELKKVYNRGFSSGFYLGLPSAKDFAKVEHSASIEKKHFVGKIKHYYPKINVAIVSLNSGLKVGEEICVIGKTTGIEHAKVERMEINHRQVSQGKKSEDVAINVSGVVRKNDAVYVLRRVKK